MVFCLEFRRVRSEEHTSELQSHDNLVCRLLLEKKKQKDDDQELIDELHAGQCQCDRPRVAWRNWERRLTLCHLVGVLPDELFLFFFFFNDAAPPEISPLSLHAAFPI